MITVIQLVLFCLLFTLMVRYSVRGGAVNGLFYYPKTVQKRAFEIGLSTEEEMKKKGFPIARRTIVKYREQMKIPKSSLRRE